MTTIVSSLAQVRRKQGVTQEELAIAVGVSRQTIIAIEKGNYTPSVALALKLSHKFNILVEQLFSVEEPDE